MISDGLFQRFPCDEIYGLHNSPDGPRGKVTIKPGPAMAGADFFDIRVQGRGAHGAYPHKAADPVVVAMTLGQALQTIISRNADPLEPAVISITQIHSGSAYNVIPDAASLAGTVRVFDEDLRTLIRARIRDIAAGVAIAFGATIDVEIRDVFSVLRNDLEKTDALIRGATELLGGDVVDKTTTRQMVSEDFADMLQAVPGAYCWLGMAPGAALHSPNYQFDDEVIPIGASLLAKLVEQQSRDRFDRK